MSSIECEIRSFVIDRKFKELLEFFEREAESMGDDSQVTYYFDCEQDLRIQMSDKESKLWLKMGTMHDDAREEIEIKCARGDFATLERLVTSLGYNVEIKWFRRRRRFRWRGAKITLDETEGYGRIIELERLATEESQDQMLKELRELLAELGVEPTPREEFDKRFAHYKENWRELVREKAVQ